MEKFLSSENLKIFNRPKFLTSLRVSGTVHYVMTWHFTVLYEWIYRHSLQISNTKHKV